MFRHYFILYSSPNMICDPSVDEFGCDLFTAWDLSSQSLLIVKFLHRNLSLACEKIPELSEVKDKEHTNSYHLLSPTVRLAL